MELLDEIYAVAATAAWLSLVWAYRAAKSFRDGFTENEPGRRLLDVLMRLFWFVVAFWAVSLPRIWLAIGQEGEAWRLLLNLGTLLVIAGLFWWTVADIRRIATDEPEYDPYEKPFGDL